MREHHYFVYIMTNCSRHPLYTGVTRSVGRRSAQRKAGFDGPTSYTARYQIDRLVYFERFQYVRDAIRREKRGSWFSLYEPTKHCHPPSHGLKSHCR